MAPPHAAHCPELPPRMTRHCTQPCTLLFLTVCLRPAERIRLAMPTAEQRTQQMRPSLVDGQSWQGGCAQRGSSSHPHYGAACPRTQLPTWYSAPGSSQVASALPCSPRVLPHLARCIMSRLLVVGLPQHVTSRAARETRHSPCTPIR
jgi:hypothetical protein